MRYCIVIILVISLYSCKSITGQRNLENKYSQSLSFFADTLVSHFPKSLECATFSTDVLGKADKIKYYFRTFTIECYQKYSDQEYDRIQILVDSLSKKTYVANDSMLLLLFTYQDKLEVDDYLFTDQASPEKKRMVMTNFEQDSCLPIPFFRDKSSDTMYTGSTYSGLKEGFILHVFDAQPGIFLPKELLYDSSECLPEKWRHGFSRGEALNEKEKEVIFWIVVW